MLRTVRGQAGGLGDMSAHRAGIERLYIDQGVAPLWAYLLSVKWGVIPTLPAILGGTWGSGSQRILRHSLVLCFFCVQRCTRKRTIFESDKDQMGSFRRVEGRGALVVSLYVFWDKSRGSPPWPGWRHSGAGGSVWSLLVPRTSGFPSCPYPTHTLAAKPHVCHLLIQLEI